MSELEIYKGIVKKMKDDEIKEILEYWKFYIDEPNNYKLLNVHFNEIKRVLDYITNLQQENQELNDSITWWNNRFNAVQRDYENYKSRIEKAVEYLKTRVDSSKASKWELLNILNGRSDE